MFGKLLRYKLLMGAAGLVVGYICRKPIKGGFERVICEAGDFLGLKKTRTAR